MYQCLLTCWDRNENIQSINYKLLQKRVLKDIQRIMNSLTKGGYSLRSCNYNYHYQRSQNSCRRVDVLQIKLVTDCNKTIVRFIVNTKAFYICCSNYWVYNCSLSVSNSCKCGNYVRSLSPYQTRNNIFTRLSLHLLHKYLCIAEFQT